MVSRREADQRFKPVKHAGIARELPDYVGMADWYARSVSSGDIPANKYAVLACQRYLKMRAKAGTAGCEYVWSDADVADACSFIEKLPHVKAFEGRIVLEPFQCWVIAGIFGFRDADTGKRFIRQVSIYLPRKNAKSALAVGIALFCANFEGEPGAEVVICAGSEDQANKVYAPLRMTVDKAVSLKAYLKAKTTNDFTRFEATGALVKVVAARAKNLDGENPHVVVAEELHAQDRQVVSVLRTARGSRTQPLFLSISTAGRSADGVAWEDWNMCKRILEGRLHAPRVFSVIFTVDNPEEGNHFHRAVIEAANPMYGVSLLPSAVDAEILDARRSNADLAEYKRTRLNIWTRGAGQLIQREHWDACADEMLKLASLKRHEILVGVDLASRSDLNSVCYYAMVAGCRYAINKFWICENSPRFEDDRFADQFRQWADDGHLIITPGSYVDFNIIAETIYEDLKGATVRGVALDDYQANMLAGQLERKGYPAYIVAKRAKWLTMPTDSIVAAARDPALLTHDGNPVMAWCAENTCGFKDENGNILPKKEDRNSPRNIDGMDALILAEYLSLARESGTIEEVRYKGETGNPFLQRGLLGE